MTGGGSEAICLSRCPAAKPLARSVNRVFTLPIFNQKPSSFHQVFSSKFQYTTAERKITMSFKLIKPLGCQRCCSLHPFDALFKTPAALFPTLCSFSRVSFFSHGASNSFVLLPPSFNLRVVFLFLGDSAHRVHARAGRACALAARGINPLFTGVRHESWEW